MTRKGSAGHYGRGESQRAPFQDKKKKPEACGYSDHLGVLGSVLSQGSQITPCFPLLSTEQHAL